MATSPPRSEHDRLVEYLQLNPGRVTVFMKLAALLERIERTGMTIEVKYTREAPGHMVSLVRRERQEFH